ncbi:MAG: DNA starvation/stationary phase protection protein Dps [Sumerlaeia bacterium]
MTNKKKPTQNKTKNPLPSKTRETIIQLLEKRLADASDLQAQIKVAHWNVKGPSFIALHELFDKIYGDVAEMVDDLAERLVSLGGQTQATVQHTAKLTSLVPYPTEITKGEDHVEAVSTVLAQYAANLQESIDAADDADDSVTEDLLIGHLATIDQYIWFVEAHKG